MPHTLLSGILVWVIAILLCAAGAAFYFLRQNFRKDVKRALPKKKKASKAKAKVASRPHPERQPEAQKTATHEGPETHETRTEITVDLSQLTGQQVEQEQQDPVPELPSDLPHVPSVQQDDPYLTQIHTVTSIHVAIWPYDRVLERLRPEHAFEALSEFQAIGMDWAEKNQVIYERSSGGSFFLHWIDGGTDVAQAADALKCALELKQEFLEWNDVRSAQAFPPFKIVMGADRGPGIYGPIGPENDRRVSVVGEVIARARALSQIALSLGANLLSSEELWSSHPNRYLGQRVAEAHLTAFENITAVYKVRGYFGEQGQEIWLKGSADKLDPASCPIDAPRIEKSDQPSLWRVNNGSQILGPMSARDVGRALYSLDLDFDCECWEEGRGNRVTIEKSGMFGAGEEADAFFWVFDGETVHGPLTEGFLKTGMGRKVFPRDSYVCEKSTVNGWRPLIELRASLNEVSKETVAEASVETPAETLPEPVAAEPVFNLEAPQEMVADMPPPPPPPAPELHEAPVIVLEQPLAAPVAPGAPVALVANEAQPEAETSSPSADGALIMPVLEAVERPRKSA